jgi:uncharacterized membrane protein YdbT with pleckstrin-like domain
MKIIDHSATRLILEQRPTDLAKVMNIVLILFWAISLIGMLILISRGLPWYFILVELLFFLFIPAILNETALTLCIFDKRANQLTIKRQSWLSRKFSIYALDEIQDVQLKSSVKTAGENERVEVYEIGITLVSGRYLKLHRPTITCDQNCMAPVFASVKSFLKL